MKMKKLLAWFLVYVGSLFLVIPLVYLVDAGGMFGVLIIVNSVWIALGLICLGIKLMDGGRNS